LESCGDGDGRGPVQFKAWGVASRAGCVVGPGCRYVPVHVLTGTGLWRGSLAPVAFLTRLQGFFFVWFLNAFPFERAPPSEKSDDRRPTRRAKGKTSEKPKSCGSTRTRKSWMRQGRRLAARRLGFTATGVWIQFITRRQRALQGRAEGAVLFFCCAICRVPLPLLVAVSSSCRNDTITLSQ
jgi:hypothetical protein